jgi:hypothetical protein
MFGLFPGVQRAPFCFPENPCVSALPSRTI